MDEETSSNPKVELQGRAERGSESGSEGEEAEAEGEPDVGSESRKAETEMGPEAGERPARTAEKADEPAKAGRI